MPVCPNCGKEVEEAGFCPYCGSKLKVGKRRSKFKLRGWRSKLENFRYKMDLEALKMELGVLSHHQKVPLTTAGVGFAVLIIGLLLKVELIIFAAVVLIVLGGALGLYYGYRKAKLEKRIYKRRAKTS